MDLIEMLDRYSTLRDTIQGLKTEQDELGKKIKEALARGADIETDLYHAQLKVSRRLEYPVASFRETFGDSMALEVASIDRKKVEALAKTGDLDGEQLAKLAKVTEIHSLHLIPKS